MFQSASGPMAQSTFPLNTDNIRLRVPEDLANYFSANNRHFEIPANDS